MTDRELAAQAEAAFRATTITYQDWQRRIAQGKYADVTKTQWWKGFDALDKIGAVVAPPPAGTYKTRFTNLAAASVGDNAALTFGGRAAFYQQEKAPDRVSIASLNGENVIRVNCRTGDNNVAGSGSGERAEIMRDNPTAPIATELTWHDEDSFVIRTEFMLDPTFKSPGFLYQNFQAWNCFFQIHHEGQGQVPWQLNLSTDTAKLGMRLVGGGNQNGSYYGDGTPVGSTTEWWWTKDGPPTRQVQNGGWVAGANGIDPACHAVTKGVWHPIVISVKWSSAGAGHARVWIDGIQRFNASNRKVGYANMTAYWKQGFYRAGYGGGDSLLYFRDLYSFATEADALAFTPATSLGVGT